MKKSLTLLLLIIIGILEFIGWFIFNYSIIKKESEQERAKKVEICRENSYSIDWCYSQFYKGVR